MTKIKMILVIYTLLMSIIIVAKDDYVVITKLRGRVTIEDSSDGTLVVGDRIPFGKVVSTGSKSFVKMRYPDNSQVLLGGNSKIAIKKTKTNDPGVLGLVYGKMKAVVQPSNIRERSDHKFFVVTKNAAMGVRGTSFWSKFDRKTEKTTLLTESGLVSFVKTQNNLMNLKDTDVLQEKLKKSLFSKKARLVKKHQLSIVEKNSQFASLPKQIKKNKFERITRGDSNIDSTQAERELQKIKLRPVGNDREQKNQQERKKGLEDKRQNNSREANVRRKESEEGKKIKSDEEIRKRRQQEDEKARSQNENESRRRSQEQDVEQRRKEQDAKQRRKEQDAEQRRKEQDAAQRRKEQDAEQRRKERDVEQRRKEQDAEQRRKEQDAAQRRKEQDAAQRRKERDVEQRRKEQDAEQRRKEKDAAQRRKEQDAEQRRKEQEIAQKMKAQAAAVEQSRKEQEAAQKMKELQAAAVAEQLRKKQEAEQQAAAAEQLRKKQDAAQRLR
ncbi:FecR domain-containing protein [Bacteriovoracaceae bacterium]|nr:FecR domain-containing protein [Bacteriovoracaceae bacterium]